jgi:hypothetical protein
MLEQYLFDDPRRAVKTLCLKNMALLAKKAPHMWESKDIQVDLILIVPKSNDWFCFFYLLGFEQIHFWGCQ